MKTTTEEPDDILSHELERIRCRKTLPLGVQQGYVFIDCLRICAREIFVSPMAPNLTETQKTVRRGKAAHDFLRIINQSKKLYPDKTLKDLEEFINMMMKQEDESPSQFCVFKNNKGKDEFWSFTEVYELAINAIRILKELQKGGAK